MAAVFPDLVRYGDGEEPEGVRYQLLSVLLLNEVQKQQRKNERQQEEIADLSARLARLESQAGQQACR